MSKFNTKEDYIKFTTAWKAACHHKNNKKYLVKSEYGNYKTGAWLTGAHFILRNYLLDNELHRGFSPKGAKKRSPYEDPWLSFGQNLWTLQSMIRDAQSYFEKDNEVEMQKWIDQGKKGFLVKKTERTPEDYKKHLEERYGNRARKFLEPFGAAFTINDLAKVNLDDIKTAKESLPKAA